MIDRKILVVIIIFFILGTLLFVNNNASKRSQTKATPSSGQTRNVSQNPQGFSIVLGQQNNSRETGLATIEGVDNKTKITLTLVEFPKKIKQPAHVHLGSCSDPGEVKYPLNNVVDGKSETTIDVDVNKFIKEFPMIVNIHKSIEEANLYVSCGYLLLK